MFAYSHLLIFFYFWFVVYPCLDTKQFACSPLVYNKFYRWQDMRIKRIILNLIWLADIPIRTIQYTIRLLIFFFFVRSRCSILKGIFLSIDVLFSESIFRAIIQLKMKTKKNNFIIVFIWSGNWIFMSHLGEDKKKSCMTHSRLECGVCMKFTSLWDWFARETFFYSYIIAPPYHTDEEKLFLNKKKMHVVCVIVGVDDG